MTLSDLLCPDTTHKNALNNRRVAIKRLKSVLEEIDDIKLEKTNKIYQIVIGEKTYIDFVEYKKIIEEHDSARIQELIKLLSRGVFLYKVDRPWADELKNKVTNQIIEDIANLLNINTIATNDKISLADILLLNDPVDEFAIKKKIEFLLSSGQVKSAELAFKKFRKNYFEFFNEEFKEKFI